MDLAPELVSELDKRMHVAEQRYGDFASTHEALGVALEEWDELRTAVQKNAIAAIEWEALDMAAVLLRLAKLCRESQSFRSRSSK